MANVTSDFANIAARDTFYNNMKTLSKGMEKQGLRRNGLRFMGQSI